MLQCLGLKIYRAYPFILFGTFKHYNPLIVNFGFREEIGKI